MTKALREFGLRLWSALIAVLVLNLSLATAFAQEIDAPSLGPQKSYVNQYFLVGFCLALGFLVICRPKSRESEVDKDFSLTS